MKDEIEKLVTILTEHQVQFLLIGKGAAILYGYPGTTQDIDIFPKRSRENGARLVRALNELGFELDVPLSEAISQCKDFIQIRGGPFPLDIIFAPDGIKTFEEADREKVIIDGKFPVASLKHIIASKKAAGRRRDKDEMERLESFWTELKRQH